MPDRPPILPPLRRTARDAEAFARIVHADQRDKAGQPYVGHLERVAKRAVAYAEQYGVDVDQVEQIAWLHGTIEDTDHTADDLLTEGFAPQVAAGVRWLTKRGNGSYGDWIADLCARAPLPALIVKVADVEDSADPARLSLLPADKRARLVAKYAGPLERLRAAVGERQGS